MRAFLLGLLVLVMSLSLTNCAGVAQRGSAIQVLITNVFPNHSIQAGTAPVTLTADVANDPHAKGVSWTLTVANVGCSPDCGTLVAQGSPSLSAIYTPPAKAPLNQQATITATALDDPTSQYSFLFTIIPTTSVSITNKFTTIVAGTPPVVVQADVLDDLTNSGLAWTLTAGGSACAPACGTLNPAAAPSFQATYTPPAVVPAGANASPTITATSVANSAATDNFSFTIESPASLLSGTYIFLLRGYDSFSGSPMAMAGSITADGKGNIASGEVDFNNGGGITHVPSPATGAYAIDISFNGMTRGTIEISSFKFPNSNIDLQFRFVLSSDRARGRIIELDGSGYLNSGTIELQNLSGAPAAPSGNFAFGLDSDAPLAGRTVSAGQLVFGAAGITGGVLDQSKAGDPAPTYSAAAIGASAVVTPDSNGRGTFSIGVNGVVSDYAYYLVDSDHLRLVQIDQGLTFGTVQAGTAIRQKTLTAASVNGTGVIQLTGMDEPGGTDTPGPDAIIGVMTISGGNAFNLTFDSNDLGTILTSHPAAGAIASFDPGTGRAVVSDPGGFESGFVDSAVIYLYDAGSGFVIDTDISTPDGTPPAQAITNDAFSGTLTPQTGGPFNGASALSGNLVVGFGGSASADVPNWDLGFALNSSNGTYAAAGELTSLPSQDGEAVNAQFSGTYSMLNTVLGHGRFQVPAALFGDFTSGNTVTASFYLIAPNRFVLIGVASGLHSGVAFFDPQ
ncbi:MAG TPA: hypothetical protein VMM16_12100 [Verrucomicrobiae bacterium]|nr:hypothetical protein [Verrucomicrobiae bacterium]